jgi:hypothetical protein
LTPRPLLNVEKEILLVFGFFAAGFFAANARGFALGSTGFAFEGSGICYNNSPQNKKKSVF